MQGWVAGARARLSIAPCQSMGVIADAFRRDLDALKARHAEHDRRLAELLKSTRELIEKTEKMLAEDRPQ
jgi:hypothetical protein